MTEPSRVICAGDERLTVSPKTLIVEDEPDLLNTCVRLLQQIGHTCLAAHTGRDAITLIDTQHPDLVVTDYFLPAVDGLSVARHARRVSPPVPVVVITAYSSGETKRQARAAGALVFLPKPFSAAEFLDAVRGALAAPTNPEIPR